MYCPRVLTAGVETEWGVVRSKAYQQTRKTIYFPDALWGALYISLGRSPPMKLDTATSILRSRGYRL